MKREIQAIDYVVFVRLELDGRDLKRTYILDKPFLKTDKKETYITYQSEMGDADDHEHGTLDALAEAIVRDYRAICASDEWRKNYEFSGFANSPLLRIQNESGSVGVSRHKGTIEISSETYNQILYTVEIELGKSGKLNDASWRPLGTEEMDALYLHVARLLTQ